MRRRVLSLYVSCAAPAHDFCMSACEVHFRVPSKFSAGCRCPQTWSGPLPTMEEACRRDNQPAVKELLRRGADVNASLNVSTIGGDMLCRSDARHVRRCLHHAPVIGIVVARAHMCKHCTRSRKYTPVRPHSHPHTHTHLHVECTRARIRTPTLASKHAPCMHTCRHGFRRARTQA